MFDPERLLGQMLGGSLGGMFGGRRGRGKRSTFGTGSLGGKATLGIGLLGVAMAAWEHYQQKPGAPTAGGVSTAHSGAVPPPAPGISAMPPPPPGALPAMPPMSLPNEHQQSIVLLIRAMIAAANADGHIDSREREAILGRAREVGLDADTLAFLDAELATPQTLQQVVANAKPELAAELYAASAIAITVDTDAEKQWLDMLAYGLRLDPQVRSDIEKRIATPA